MKLWHLTNLLVNAIQCRFSYKEPGCTCTKKNYLFCEKSNRRLEFNDNGFFFVCQYKKEVRKCYKGSGLVEAMYFLLNIAVIYLIFSLKKILFYYNFCQKWLDTLHYLLPIQIAFFSRISLPSQNPKQQTVEWVSDGYLTQTQQFSVITWREQTNFKWDDVRFVLDQNV